MDGRKIFMDRAEYADSVESGVYDCYGFDECPPSVADRAYVQASVDRTTRWPERCKVEMNRLLIFRGYD